jgi:hypothetical protein
MSEQIQINRKWDLYSHLSKLKEKVGQSLKTDYTEMLCLCKNIPETITDVKLTTQYSSPVPILKRSDEQDMTMILTQDEKETR